MPFGNSVESPCLACALVLPHAKKLSEHVKGTHGLSPADYWVRYHLGGSAPSCPTCGRLPRFSSISFGFMRYCVDHARVAQSEGGRRGGAAPAWNKGLTGETDPRIAAAALKQVGTRSAALST